MNKENYIIVMFNREFLTKIEYLLNFSFGLKNAFVYYKFSTKSLVNLIYSLNRHIQAIALIIQYSLKHESIKILLSNAGKIVIKY